MPVYYDKNNDILYVYKKGKVKFSLEILSNFIVDLDHSNKVVGLEILNASKVLKVPKKDL